ncbi:hypothetical protein IX332_000408 [Porphyromonas levii]|nr:hypothetical protein [Porphyromonas levii]MBR8730789.1 hypothetical protein [Porphyromonas levii]MBR8763525.1 hypothetical protein [Porphyromonas levii]MBR8766422.1 hypothetical protein [Porphyromonas levii]
MMAVVLIVHDSQKLWKYQKFSIDSEFLKTLLLG